MLNQIHVNSTTEAAHSSGLFLKNYIDYVEDFPDDIARIFSICREIDIETNNIVNEADELSQKIVSATGDKKAKLFSRLHTILCQLQDFNDDKIHYGQILSDMIETKFRAVDRDFQNNVNSKPERIQSPVPASSSTARNREIVQQVFSSLPLKNTSAPGSNMSSSTNNSASENNNGNGSGQDKSAKRIRRTLRTDTNLDAERVETPVKVEPAANKQPAPQVQASTSVVKKAAAGNVAGKKKKTQRKTSGRQSGLQSSQAVQEVAGAIQDDTVDPDEETYCLCGQISYGEMILCENDICEIEWFHFSCVSLQSKPKGRWYCPSCRGDRPNVMKKNLRKKYQDSPNADRKFI